jgi:hypothetical protein
LWWHQAGLADQHLDQHPRRQAAEDRGQRALRRRALPEGAEEERHEGAGQRDLVGVLDHLEDRGVGVQREAEHDAGEADDGDAHHAQEGVVAHAGKKPRTMFSEKATDGASSVADEQLMMAESTAPKKMHLGEDRRVLQDQRRQDQLRVGLHQAR